MGVSLNPDSVAPLDELSQLSDRVLNNCCDGIQWVGQVQAIEIFSLQE